MIQCDVTGHAAAPQAEHLQAMECTIHAPRTPSEVGGLGNVPSNDRTRHPMVGRGKAMGCEITSASPGAMAHDPIAHWGGVDATLGFCHQGTSRLLTEGVCAQRGHSTHSARITGINWGFFATIDNILASVDHTTPPQCCTT